MCHRVANWGNASLIRAQRMPQRIVNMVKTVNGENNHKKGLGCSGKECLAHKMTVLKYMP